MEELVKEVIRRKVPIEEHLEIIAGIIDELFDHETINVSNTSIMFTVDEKYVNIDSNFWGDKTDVHVFASNNGVNRSALRTTYDLKEWAPGYYEEEGDDDTFEKVKELLKD